MGLSGREHFLSGLDGEERLAFAAVFDRAARSERFGGAAFGDFLSMDEQSRLAPREKYLPSEPMLFGGYSEAERRMAGFNCDEADYPIAALKIRGKGLSALTHRDYLGALMSLGIERCKLGDIKPAADGAIVFVHSDIKNYIINTLSQIGHCNVQAEEVSLDELDLGTKSFEYIKGTVASLRLDSIVSMLVKKSRAQASALINAGRVYINGLSCERTDARVSDGDVITVRGFGKAAVEIGGTSKKERIFVTLKKYA